MHRERKRILLVAIPGSIHTARWLQQINVGEWDIHLFPSLGGEVVHHEIVNVTVQHLFFCRRINKQSPELRGQEHKLSVPRIIDFIRERVIEHFFPQQRTRQLMRLIRKINPDIIHSMEIQAAGYLTLEAKKQLKEKFPPWIVTNWGSDIYLFGRLQKHKDKIRDVLANCEYYSCECQRDTKLARQFGFEKTILPVFPNTGGFDLEALESFRNKVVTSRRKTIMLKGYQGWAGRALVGLRALARCADVLAGYVIKIYSANDDVIMAAELLTESTGIPTEIIPAHTTHAEMLSLFSKARISIGLSISDAVSTSLLEAMVMGSFPVQSCTACAEEWVQHGISGMIVPPEDPEIIEKAVRKVLSSDELVNNAAKINWQTAQARLDDSILKQKAVEVYRGIIDSTDSGGISVSKAPVK